MRPIDKKFKEFVRRKKMKSKAQAERKVDTKENRINELKQKADKKKESKKKVDRVM